MRSEIYGRVLEVKNNKLIFAVEDAKLIADLSAKTGEKWPAGVLIITDNRQISRKQMRKIYALMNDIADYAGISRLEIKDVMKSEWVAETGEPWFSIGGLDMTTAREFITFLLEFAIRWHVPLKKSGLDYQDDIEAYMTMSLMHRSCVVCGLPADVHHVDTIGMGNDRTTNDHRNHRLIALCREHHNEAHNMGWPTFSELYHVEGVYLDADQLVRLGLMTKRQVEEFDNEDTTKGEGR